ncbi:MAG: aldolase/citrate lyase family protein [Chloroflexi bacterium]|nr:aldolase/citrate lyase family protein [Chloroflexota bacterium]
MINTARQRMLAGQPALGIVLGLGSPTAAGILARCGFDFVLVDNQHGDWDDATTLAAFRNISLGSAIPMTRVRKNDFYAIGRMLDRGALGIIVPMVNSADEARAAAFAMRYPPFGGRSFAGCLAVHYGADYDTWADREVFLAVQIETAPAAQHAEEIMAVEGVDGCWIGPMDLARSMGVAPGAPTHEDAILRVLAACRKTGKIPGIYTPNAAVARRRIEQGFQFVTTADDGGLIAAGAREVLRQLERVS